MFGYLVLPLIRATRAIIRGTRTKTVVFACSTGGAVWAQKRKSRRGVERRGEE